VSWLGSSREFLGAVKSIPITAGPGIEPRGWGSYEESQRVDEAGMLADRTQFDEMTAAGQVTGEQWRAAIGGTPRDHLASVLELVRSCEQEVDQLKSLGDDKFDEDAPNLIELGELLYDCREYLEHTLAGEAAAGAEGAEEGGEATAEGMAVEAGAAPSAPAGPIASRDEAYRRLREVAEYLRRTEPHSPVSYLVERAISWGQMPFQAVIRDVLGGNAPAYATVLETLGIDDS
jgi:type VI secretion system ImpA family protein